MFLTLDLKPSTHCSSVAAMAFNRSSLLLKGFRSKDVSVLVRLYKVWMRKGRRSGEGGVVRG